MEKLPISLFCKIFRQVGLGPDGDNVWEQMLATCMFTCLWPPLSELTVRKPQSASLILPVLPAPEGSIYQQWFDGS